MTPEVKTAIEKVIALMQRPENQGNLSFKEARVGLDICNSDNNLFEAVKFQLKELQLATTPDINRPGHWKLLSNGWAFTTFEDLEKKKAEERENQELQASLVKKEFQKVNLEIQDLANRLSDYEQVKKDSEESLKISRQSLTAARRANTISVVTAIAIPLILWLLRHYKLWPFSQGG